MPQSRETNFNSSKRAKEQKKQKFKDMFLVRMASKGISLTIVVYPLGNFGQASWIRSCHEDLILIRKSHNCTGVAFIQGDSAGGFCRWLKVDRTDFKQYFCKNVYC